MRSFHTAKKWALTGLLSSLLVLTVACQIHQDPHSVNAVNTNKVNLTNSLFTPARILISKGETVTWTNNDLADHTVTSTHGKALNSPVLKSGQSYSHTFNHAGAYPYHSSLNDNMNGLVEVR